MSSAVYDPVSTRDAFGEILLKKARENDDLYFVAADTMSVGGKQLHSQLPNRAINVGIAEQNMALVAAGMASCGAKVVVASYAAFCSMRMTEQLRSFICYPDLDVKVVAGLGGLSGGQEGVTHQGIEDVGVLRSIPNLTIIEAADAASTRVIADVLLDHVGPAYLRLGRDPFHTVFDETYQFAIGRANVMEDAGDDITVFATGAAVHRAKLAVDRLRARGVGARLVEMPTIKPLDEDAVIDAARRTPLLLTVEDHSVIGGLGSAVSEVVAGCENTTARVVRIGIDDEFTETGDHEELLDKYNLSVQHIADTAARELAL